MSKECRPNYTTIRGGIAAKYKSATAASESKCPMCDDPVMEDEPIYLVGVSFKPNEDDDRTKPGKVDLSDAEWVCVHCLQVVRGG